MFGDQITIAPVVRSSTSDPPSGTTSHLWVPPGDWFSYMDGTMLTGPKFVERYWDLKEIPILVKAGSILVKRGMESIIGQQYLGTALLDYTDLVFEVIPGRIAGNWEYRL
jgi:alpha-glucosidase (family GH31 glycosyl hydrolase)